MSAPPVLPLAIGQQGALELEMGGARKSGPARVSELEGDLIWLALPPRIVQVLASLGGGGPATFDTSRPMDARYLVDGTLIATRTEPEPAVALRVDEMRRQQEREYIRVPAILELQATGPGPDGRRCQFRITSIDISAAGMLLASELPMSPGVEIGLQLPNQPQPHDVHARVVRMARTAPSANSRSELGVAFVDLPATVREQIIRFVMQVQLELRRKGMA
jgi:hypothetical protein